MTGLVLAGPVLVGLIGTILPAFGYLPAIGGVSFSFDAFKTLLAMPGLETSIGLSISAGIITPIVSLFIVSCFIAAWGNTRVFQTVFAFTSPLLSVPHAAAALGLAFLIAPSGWIVRAISPELTSWESAPDFLIVNDPSGLSLMAGLIAKEVPFLMLVMGAALTQIRHREVQRVATSMGYGKMSSWLFTVFPQLYPQIRLPVFAVIAYASSNVDMALILGPGTPAPLSVRVLEWLNDPDTSMRFVACAGAILQLVATLSALLVWRFGEILFRLIRRRMEGAGTRLSIDGIARQVSLLGMILPVLAVGFGLLGLTIWSIAGIWRFPDFFPRSFTLSTWQSQVDSLQAPLFNAALFGTISAAIAIVLAIGCFERETRTSKPAGHKALLFIYLPLLVPQIIFLFGLDVLFIAMGFSAKWGAVLLAHLIFVIPYVFLSLAQPWRSFDMRYQRTAQGLGIDENRFLLSIRLPMLLSPILAAFAVGFAVSIAQYLPTLIIGAGRFPTITTEAVALSSGGNRRVIGIYAVLQMILPFIAFVLASAIPALLYRNRIGMRAANR